MTSALLLSCLCLTPSEPVRAPRMGDERYVMRKDDLSESWYQVYTPRGWQPTWRSSRQARGYSVRLDLNRTTGKLFPAYVPDCNPVGPLQ